MTTLILLLISEVWTCGGQGPFFTNRPVVSQGWDCNKKSQSRASFNKLPFMELDLNLEPSQRVDKTPLATTVSFRPVRKEGIARAIACQIWGRTLGEDAWSRAELVVTRGSKEDYFILAKPTWSFRLPGPCLSPQVEASYTRPPNGPGTQSGAK